MIKSHAENYYRFKILDIKMMNRKICSWMHCKETVSFACFPEKVWVAGVPRIFARQPKQTCSVQQLHSLEQPRWSTGTFILTVFCEAQDLYKYITSTLTSSFKAANGPQLQSSSCTCMSMSLSWRLPFW